MVDNTHKLLREKYAQLSTGVDEYFQLLYDNAQGRDISMYDDWLKELRHDVYGLKGATFSNKIDETIDELANKLKHYLN